MNGFDKRFSTLSDKVNDELYYLGYSKIGNIGKDNLLSLKKDTDKIMSEIFPWAKEGKFFAMIDTSLSLFKKSHDIVTKNVVPPLQKFFDLNEVDIYGASHLIKPNGKNSLFKAHQDSSIVEEPSNFSLNAWIPMTNINRFNGCLWVLPGSHIFPNYFRHTYNKPLNQPKIQKEIWNRMKPVFFKAGDIFLFHRSLIHGSSKNYLPWQKLRIALECIIIPKKAEFIAYYKKEKSDNNEILMFKVDKDHFFKNEDPRGKLLNEMKNFTIKDGLPENIIENNLIEYFGKFKERATMYKSKSKRPLTH